MKVGLTGMPCSTRIRSAGMPYSTSCSRDSSSMAIIMSASGWTHERRKLRVRSVTKMT
ncbi:hypothetical protein D3C72_2545440 [compost metagenome]